MALYRIIPVEVEAIRFEYTKKGIHELKEFVGEYLGDITKARHLGAIGQAVILACEGGKYNEARHIALEGDFIIKGIKGEFLLCTPHIFNKTYKLVSE